MRNALEAPGNAIEIGVQGDPVPSRPRGNARAEKRILESYSPRQRRGSFTADVRVLARPDVNHTREFQQVRRDRDRERPVRPPVGIDRFPLGTLALVIRQP